MSLSQPQTSSSSYLLNCISSFILKISLQPPYLQLLPRHPFLPINILTNEFVLFKTKTITIAITFPLHFLLFFSLDSVICPVLNTNYIQCSLLRPASLLTSCPIAISIDTTHRHLRFVQKDTCDLALLSSLPCSLSQKITPPIIQSRNLQSIFCRDPLILHLQTLT